MTITDSNRWKTQWKMHGNLLSLKDHPNRLLLLLHWKGQMAHLAMHLQKIRLAVLNKKYADQNSLH